MYASNVRSKSKQRGAVQLNTNSAKQFLGSANYFVYLF